VRRRHTQSRLAIVDEDGYGLLVTTRESGVEAHGVAGALEDAGARRPLGVGRRPALGRLHRRLRDAARAERRSGAAGRRKMEARGGGAALGGGRCRRSGSEVADEG